MTDPRTREVRSEDEATASPVAETEESPGWRVLESQLPWLEPTRANRRRETRLPVRLPLETTTIDPVEDDRTGETSYHFGSEEHSINVSRRGLCIVCDLPPNPGTRLLIQLRPSGEARSIDLVGRTRWTRVEFEPGVQGARPRCTVGIEIMGGSPTALDRLERAMAGLEREANSSLASPEALG